MTPAPSSLARGGAPRRAAGPAGRPASRKAEYAFALALGAAGSGLVLLAIRQGWAHVVTKAPAPLPSSAVPVTGQDLAPAAEALAVAALASLAAVIATRALARRIVGAVLVLFGAALAATVGAHLSAASVLAAARGSPVQQGGSAIAGDGIPGGAGASHAGGAGLGFAGHVVMAGFPWRGAALLGAVAVIAAGALVAWRGPRWPVMSARYDRDPSAAASPSADAASLWESLSQGVDPTDSPGTPGVPPAGADPPPRDSKAGGVKRDGGPPGGQGRGGDASGPAGE